ncbi:hypothetical protein PL71_15045 [Pseudoalteromonas distincta]|uniref:Uncharacterized protein n=1 Tax=Pseudoalteromonas distincta TaxID=77608 RepID=A0ABT9GBW4_9GAMM|nr:MULTISPECIES: hypothetical protein [Pseudoalteromonas distincta group]KHM46190.1 hypothetical protein PL71_15045 [Pseudoalteromonas elyakovii]KID37015.1 hypothetical protein QT16_13420 [Pseudoalteromonas distincta]MDP4483367.1 hypothetical protein [Pseudoalteromonas elyakovii]
MSSMAWDAWQAGITTTFGGEGASWLYDDEKQKPKQNTHAKFLSYWNSIKRDCEKIVRAKDLRNKVVVKFGATKPLATCEIIVHQRLRNGTLRYYIFTYDINSNIVRNLLLLSMFIKKGVSLNFIDGMKTIYSSATTTFCTIHNYSFYTHISQAINLEQI